MVLQIERHIIDRIKRTPIVRDPYPHLLIESIFPDDFYQKIMSNLPTEKSFTKNSPGYDSRLMLSLHNPGEIEGLVSDIRGFWKDFAAIILSKNLLNALTDKFKEFLEKRFEEGMPEFFASADLVLDKRNYALGPHTDHPDKVITTLFYFPEDAKYAHMGTKIYEPLDPTFRDFAGAHHEFEGFRKIKNVEYKPNILFAFFKTDNSFHGVEKVVEQVERRLLMYNIRIPVEAIPPSQRAHVHGVL